MGHTDFGIGVVNLGAGLKAYLTEDIALRIEYRFQKFNGESVVTGPASFSYTDKVDTRIHMLQFGLSVLL